MTIPGEWFSGANGRVSSVVAEGRVPTFTSGLPFTPGQLEAQVLFSGLALTVSVIGSNP